MICNNKSSNRRACCYSRLNWSILLILWVVVFVFNFERSCGFRLSSLEKNRRQSRYFNKAAIDYNTKLYGIKDLQDKADNSMVSSKFTLKQFLNVPGLKAIGLIFTSPQLILPHYHLSHVSAIDYHLLKSKGIKCLVFDKDNTIR
jgi:hypothetical protein